MNRFRQHSDSGLGATLTLSLALHLVFFFLLAQVKTGLVPVPEQVCYVDMADLPAESPAAGTPPPPAPPAAAPAAPPPAEMSAPSPLQGKPLPAGKQPAAPAASGAADEGEEVARRIAGMGERRHQEEAMQAIAARVAAQKPAAMRGSAGGSGSRPGSDYGAYIQSRLQDNFLPPRNPGKNPRATVRITIDRNGNVTSQVEQPSDDKLFDIAVLQAVTMAKKTFPPPPDGREFSRGFVFRLQGVESK